MSATKLFKPPTNSRLSIRCECGLEILLTSDYRQLGRDIESHALAHKIQETDLDEAEMVFEKVQDRLILQVFEIIAEIKNPPIIT